MSELLKELRASKGKFDRKFYGRTHLIVMSLGVLSAKDAISELSQTISFKLDPATVPRFINIKDLPLYPMAHALASIGDVNTIFSLIEIIENSDDETAAKLSAGLILKICGKERARGLLAQQIVHRAKDGIRTSRLLNAIALLESRTGLP